MQYGQQPASCLRHDASAATGDARNQPSRGSGCSGASCGAAVGALDGGPDVACQF